MTTASMTWLTITRAITAGWRTMDIARSGAPKSVPIFEPRKKPAGMAITSIQAGMRPWSGTRRRFTIPHSVTPTEFEVTTP
jgi:hypothetical protein